jgi:hypothetical protein
MNRLTVTLIVAASLIIGFTAGHFTNANRYELIVREDRMFKYDRVTGKVWTTFGGNSSSKWYER